METTAGKFELTLDEELSLALTDVKGVGPKTAERLQEREIFNQADLLLFVPRKYRLIARFLPGTEIAKRRSSHVETVGRVADVNRPGQYSRRPLEILVNADGESFKLLWFNIPYQNFSRQFQPGRWVKFEGDVDWDRGGPSLAHPTTKVYKNEGRPATPEPSIEMEPVYPSMENINDPTVRSAIEQAAARLLPHAVDVVPSHVLRRRELMSVREALETIHLLRDFDDPDVFRQAVTRARSRLVFEEFYTLQYKLTEQYVEERRAAEAHQCEDRELGRKLVRNLPFELTGDQKETSATLADDLKQRLPMRRLLQGDVGAGKTVVAFSAAAITIGSGHQAAMMAPTDILARQHWQTAREMLEPIGVELGLMTGSQSAAERNACIQKLKAGDIDFVIGTHALFQDDVAFDSLSFVIVDEQHKFGVEQREKLLDKGRDPHLLAMTATPIPRSLAHAVFGDLDLSIIREKPPGRKPVRTFLRDRSAARKAYDYVRQRIEESGEQAYFVYPMVEASDAAPGRRSVVESAEKLANGPLSSLKVAVLHGQMDDDTKHRTMQQFADGDIDVLCATTVVEVGVDVSNATLMVIESPEMFGLSQLHQLRGRVGRGEAESMCILLAGYGLTEEAKERLTSFSGTDDGFELAEVDLEIRGPGQFLGVRQAGRAEFRFGDVLRDGELLEAAREDARREVLGDAG